jgi:hypothetical protein
MVDDKLKDKYNYITYGYLVKQCRSMLQLYKNYQVVVLLDDHQMTMLVQKIEHLSLRLLAVLLIAFMIVSLL